MEKRTSIEVERKRCESYPIHVRNGVSKLQQALPENSDVAVTVDCGAWREIVLGFRRFFD